MVSTQPRLVQQPVFPPANSIQYVCCKALRQRLIQLEDQLLAIDDYSGPGLRARRWREGTVEYSEELRRDLTGVDIQLLDVVWVLVAVVGRDTP